MVQIHSSFRGLSRRGFAAEPFCAALVEAMEGGTLLMPAMSWRTVTPAQPVFDELGTASHTGILTEIFRTGFSTHRSLHPTHSVAGVGPLAQFLLAHHHQGTTPCAANSPYGLMREYEATIILLGVGLESCTAFHHAEEVMAPDLYLRPEEEAEDYRLIDRNGHAYPMRLRRHPRLPRDFPKFAGPLAAAGALTEGTLAGTPWIRLSLRGLYQLLFRRLDENPRATLTPE